MNSTKKTWYSFLSPLTPGHGLARCYRHSSSPPTIPAKNLGAFELMTSIHKKRMLLPMQTTTFNAMKTVNLDVCTSPPPPIHISSTAMRSSVNSTKKTWYSFLSPLTPGHGLARCYRHSSSPPTIPAKNLGAPHTLTPNITNPMPTSCMNVPTNHHAHSGFSYLPTSDGHNLHQQHDGRSLVTPILHPHLYTLQLTGLSISNAYSSLLCNATRTFQLHPTAPAFDLYSFLTLEDTYPVST